MKIAILGGTFDPIHRGHLQIARNALDEFSIDQVLFIPCAIPPHKTESKPLGNRHRMAMVRAAIAGEPKFQALDIEIKRGGISYSIDTLHELRKVRAHDQIFFILGSDNFQNIETWRGFSELIQLCEFLVIERPGYPLKIPPFPVNHKAPASLRYHLMNGPTLEAASSDIRRLLREGQKVDHLLLAPVYQYIQTHRLYQSAA